MYLKPGVDISRLERNTRRGLQTITDIYEANGSRLFLNSTYGDVHMAGSLHYANQAFDTSHPEKDKEHIMILCISKLGRNWDVVPKGSYVHWEFDPK